MSRRRPVGWHVALAFVVSTLMLTPGCQTPGRRDRSRRASAAATSNAGIPSLDDSGIPTAKLGAKQVADIQASQGVVAEREGNVAGALSAYAAAIERDSSRGDACLRLAILHDQQGHTLEAAQYFQRALTLRPGDADVFCAYGYSLYLQRHWDEAEKQLRQAIAIAPQHARAHNNLALVLAHTNRPDEALREFARGGSKPAAAHASLAFAFTVDRRWAEAREQYTQAIQCDPNSPVLAARVRELDAMVARLESPSPAAAADPAVVTAAASARVTEPQISKPPAPAVKSRTLR